MSLTDKQEKFVQELIKGKSQREAYKIAYPASLKWNEKSIDEKACVLFKNVKVKSRYNELKNKVIKRAEEECIVTATDVLKELSKVTFANGTDFARVVKKIGKSVKLNEDGTQEIKEYEYDSVEINETDALDENKKAAISCIKETKFGIAVETCDKVKALELLGKHLGIFTDKQELTIKDIPQVMIKRAE